MSVLKKKLGFPYPIFFPVFNNLHATLLMIKKLRTHSPANNNDARYQKYSRSKSNCKGRRAIRLTVMVAMAGNLKEGVV